MLKTASKEKLWRIATNNIYFGGASAMVLANRMKDTEAMYIVSRVYSVSAVQDNPFTPKECQFCGCSFIPSDAEIENCCSDECWNDYNGYC